MNATKSRTDLSSVIEQKAKQLFTDEQWHQAETSPSMIVQLEYNDMMSEVLDSVYTERPELFKDISWVNDDCGFPLWVKPGVVWEPEE